jgi:hypothetical protein
MLVLLLGPARPDPGLLTGVAVVPRVLVVALARQDPIPRHRRHGRPRRTGRTTPVVGAVVALRHFGVTSVKNAGQLTNRAG